MDIKGDRLGEFFDGYSEVEDVPTVISKSGIGTVDFVLQVTLIRKSFGEIPNVLTCREKMMPLVVECRRPTTTAATTEETTTEKSTAKATAA